MKIIRITSLHHPSFEGRLDLTKELTKLGVEQILITDTKQKDIKNNQYIIQFNKHLPITVNRFLFNKKVFHIVQEILKNESIDMIIDHYGYSSRIFSDKVIQKKVKLVAYAHGSIKEDMNYVRPIKCFKDYVGLRIIDKSMKTVYENANLIIAVSENVKKEIRREYALQNKRIIVIPNGYDPTSFHYIKSNIRKKYNIKNEPVLLYVGNLIKRKGVDELIDICKDAIKKYKAKLIICGEGPLKTKILKQAQKENILNNIIILGFIERPELRQWYSSADLLVFPTKYEGSPKVIFEAMACGLPFISYSEGDVREINNKIQSGIVINNKIEFKNELQNIIKNKNQLSMLKLKSKQNGYLYTWNKIAKLTKKSMNYIVRKNFIKEI